ncbi:MAG: hypothetical protein AAF747_09260 [Planctomycetota bacterium]
MKSPDGRYAHRDCAEQAKQARDQQAASQPRAPQVQAPAGAYDPIAEALEIGEPIPVDDGEPLDAEGTLKQQQGCPKCKAPIIGSQVICTNCGLNLQTGQRIKTKIEVEKGDGGGGGGRSINIPEPVFGLLLLLAQVGVTALGFVDESLFGVGLLLGIILSYVAWIWMIIAAFQDDNAGWGIAILVTNLCGGIIGFGLAVAYALTQLDGRPILRMLYFSQIVAFVLSIILIINGIGIDGLAELLGQDGGF